MHLNSAVLAHSFVVGTACVGLNLFNEMSLTGKEWLTTGLFV